MKLVILNYELGEVHIINNVPNSIEDSEDFVYNKLGYKDSSISWILVKDDARFFTYTYDGKSAKYDNENFLYDGCKN